jgi:hypothetical protein
MEVGYFGASGAAVLVWSDRPLSQSGRLTWQGQVERLTRKRFAASVPARRCPACQVGFFDYGEA